MNISKFTQKSIAGSSESVKRLPTDHGNQEIDTGTSASDAC